MLDRLFALYVSSLNGLRAREEGQTMVEYALVLGLVVMAVAAVVLTGITGAVTGILTDITTKLGGIVS